MMSAERSRDLTLGEARLDRSIPYNPFRINRIRFGMNIEIDVANSSNPSVPVVDT